MVGNSALKEFNNFCAKHGIQRQYSTSYTPPQNGVVERWNHTITEMDRCMLQNMSIPHKFWVEAMFAAVYLINRSPTMAVKQKTPKEVWSGQKCKVSHLKAFGFVTQIVWCHLHQKNFENEPAKASIIYCTWSYAPYVQATRPHQDQVLGYQVMFFPLARPFASWDFLWDSSFHHFGLPFFVCSTLLFLSPYM